MQRPVKSQSLGCICNAFWAINIPINIIISNTHLIPILNGNEGVDQFLVMTCGSFTSPICLDESISHAQLQHGVA